MAKDKFSKMLVDSIIGDIIDLNFDDEDFEEITDEEIAEFEALPKYEITPEMESRMKAFNTEILAWLSYRFGMEAKGLPFLDLWEWRNMEVKPTVPGEE